MSKFIDENDVLDKLAAQLQQDQPTIYASVKNLSTFLLAKGDSPSTGSPADTDIADHIDTLPQVPARYVMSFAKYLLEAVRNCELLSLEEFCAAVPQSEDQSGVDRIDVVCKYKVVLALQASVVSKGGKVTRLFGQSYFAWSYAWRRIRDLAVALMTQNTGAPLELVKSYLDKYESTMITIAKSPPSASGMNDDSTFPTVETAVEITVGDTVTNSTMRPPTATTTTSSSASSYPGPSVLDNPASRYTNSSESTAATSSASATASATASDPTATSVEGRGDSLPVGVDGVAFDASLAELVWAKDFQQVLLTRQRARSEKAKLRVRELGDLSSILNPAPATAATAATAAAAAGTDPNKGCGSEDINGDRSDDPRVVELAS